MVHRSQINRQTLVARNGHECAILDPTIGIHIDTLLKLNVLFCFVKRHWTFAGIGILLYVLYNIEKKIIVLILEISLVCIYKIKGLYAEVFQLHICFW